LKLKEAPFAKNLKSIDHPAMMDMQNNTFPHEVICHCSGVTRDELRCLQAAGFNMDAISRRTGAITGCGGCEWDIAEFMQSLSAQKGPCL
jgi:bacterioferritin-associated ferredoxin